jgi:hypothetical protein
VQNITLHVWQNDEAAISHLVLWHNSLHQGKITGKQLVNYGDPCFFLNKA